MTNPQDTPQDTNPQQVEGQEPTTPQEVPAQQETQQPEVPENPQGDGQEPKPGGNPDNHEAAKYRVRLREQEKANAELQAQFEAKQAEQDQLVQQIGKAFGFIQEDDNAGQPDAAQILEQVTAERDALNAKLREQSQQIALNNAITGFKSPDGKPVPLDPDLTLAVIKGTGALNDLDPAADDYASQVEQIVTATVEAHPQLRTQVVPKSSGQSQAPTDNGDGGKLTREDLARMTSAEINKAAAEGKLNHLMNQ